MAGQGIREPRYPAGAEFLGSSLGGVAADSAKTRKVVVLSSRGPIEHYFGPKERIMRRPADGGVATVLSAVAERTNTTWIAAARSQADRLVAKGGNAIKLNEGSRLRLIAPPANADDLHQDFCNTVLWFLQHSMLHLIDQEDLEKRALDAWQRGYLPVNMAFAEGLSSVMGPHVDAVMIHDYHLYVAPLLIRCRYRNAFLQHFIHIPWPKAEAWSALPVSIVESICRGLLANDSVVFQTAASAQNFLDTCAAFLPAAQIDGNRQVVYRGQTTRVWSNPVSVDATALERQLSGRELSSLSATISQQAGERTIVRVDRLDPSKNIDGGFGAYDLLLQRHPEWRGRVHFLAFLVPSRTDLNVYQQHRSNVMAQVEAINARYGSDDWTPITVYYEQNRTQALAAMTLYDVLLVNSRADGQNLVSKEGPLLNQKDGVLVLSRHAGSFEELRDGAVGVDPIDIAATADALHEALRMSPIERRERASYLRHAVLRHQSDDWLALMLRDMVRPIEAEAPSDEPTMLPEPRALYPAASLTTHALGI